MTMTLYHAPHTRSTRVLALIHAMGKLDEIEIKTVTITTQDGSGGPDPANPHPEKKVPLLVHNGEMIRESSAIMIYLTDHFKSPLGPQIGEAGRGAYLSWMTYYAGVVEPVIIGKFMGVLDNPVFAATFRGEAELNERLKTGLEGRDWLIGDTLTAADMIMSSPYQWMPSFLPDIPVIKDWVARCASHESVAWAADR